MPGSSDEALISGMAHGDERSAVAFVRRYQKRVYGLAFGMLGDPGTAEEVAQEALIRAWRHAPVFDVRRGSAATWVLTIARNLAIDALRLHRAVPTDPDHFVGLGMVSRDRGPEDWAVVADAAPPVRNALASLPEEQRRALVLAAVYGRTAAEISESESIPLGTAKTRVRTAMAKMRVALEARENR
jgi:RNA polymerase sigma factor (sigma-70 family)